MTALSSGAHSIIFKLSQNNTVPPLLFLYLSAVYLTHTHIKKGLVSKKAWWVLILASYLVYPLWGSTNWGEEACWPSQGRGSMHYNWIIANNYVWYTAWNHCHRKVLQSWYTTFCLTQYSRTLISELTLLTLIIILRHCLTCPFLCTGDPNVDVPAILLVNCS